MPITAQEKLFDRFITVSLIVLAALGNYAVYRIFTLLQ